jgi:hypothetical protein
VDDVNVLPPKFNREQTTQCPEVFHFTCTARLPWIVTSGELRPGRNQIGNFPDPDFLWATTRSQGDRTAAGLQGYRKGFSALVRLTLHAEDFEAWPAITARFPQWTSKYVWALEAAARRRGETNVSCWRARAEPLPLSRIIRAEAKTYRGSWQDIELTSLRCPTNPALRGIVLDDHVYCSFQHIEDRHATTYTAGIMSLEDWRS